MERSALLLGFLKRITQPRELVVSKGALARFSVFPSCDVAVLMSENASSVAAKKVIAYLDKSGARTTRCVVPNGEPTSSGVAGLATALLSINPSWIVAIGGGRVIDNAKLAWAAYQSPALDFATPGIGEIPPPQKACRLAAVPTTAGSGSESSIAAVVTHDGRKMPWISHHWVPDLVVLDPEAMKGLSPELMAETGLDALAHAIEAFVSRLENSAGKRFAREAAIRILESLPLALNDPTDIAALEAIQYGAYMAGLAQSASSTGLAHALSHAIGARYHVPHARATAFMLGRSISFNLRHGDAKVTLAYEGLARALDLDHIDALLERIDNIFTRTAIPAALSSLVGQTLDPIGRKALAELVSSEQTLRTNVMPIQDVTMIEALIDEMA